MNTATVAGKPLKYMDDATATYNWGLFVPCGTALVRWQAEGWFKTRKAADVFARNLVSGPFAVGKAERLA